MNLEDLNSIDFNNIGSLPIAAKLGIIVIAFLGMLGAGYWFDTQGRIESWNQAQAKEQQKRTEFQNFQKEASSLNILKKQMLDLSESFKIMLKQLPRKAEVDALLVDISQTGIAAGLQFDLFKPGAPSSDEFQNLPIQIVVIGNYHQLGQFVSGVASLPRIVTLHNVTLKILSDKDKKDKDKDKKVKLSMEALAKIYHYSEDEAKK